MAKQKTASEGLNYVSKKCHSCYEYVPLNAEICPSCKARLGKVGEHGMAEPVTNWHAYIKFLIALAVFLVFCKYAFF